ncbi:MAG: hypothetical protein H6874_12565 [Hyphomicrobiaceae bacterium]|nr:hypothetical protein [Hyphomicrobiaceae bacterium]
MKITPESRYGGAEVVALSEGALAAVEVPGGQFDAGSDGVSATRRLKLDLRKLALAQFGTRRDHR